MVVLPECWDTRRFLKYLLLELLSNLAFSNICTDSDFFYRWIWQIRLLPPFWILCKWGIILCKRRISRKSILLQLFTSSFPWERKKALISESTITKYIFPPTVQRWKCESSPMLTLDVESSKKSSPHQAWATSERFNGRRQKDFLSSGVGCYTSGLHWFALLHFHYLAEQSFL